MTQWCAAPDAVLKSPCRPASGRHSCLQARRLDIRLRTAKGPGGENKKEFVHMLNGTLSGAHLSRAGARHLPLVLTAVKGLISSALCAPCNVLAPHC